MGFKAAILKQNNNNNNYNNNAAQSQSQVGTSNQRSECTAPGLRRYSATGKKQDKQDELSRGRGQDPDL